MKSKQLVSVTFSICFFLFSMVGYAQKNTTNQEVAEMKKQVQEMDSKFWKAYNSCDIEGMSYFLTKDLEFYHDKGGLTNGLKTFRKQLQNGLCGNPNNKLRREVKDETVQLFPISNYGILMTGEHYFYLSEGGNEERLVEKAKFTHLWKMNDGKWKMSRVISYDHQPASENEEKQVQKMDTNDLKRLVGTYVAPNTGTVLITIESDGSLKMDAGRMKAKLHPESKSLFFIKEAPLTLEFVKNDKGEVTKFIVRENGKVVEEAEKTE